MTMPMNLHPQYIVDEKGNKTSVLLPIDEFENIKINLENLESIETKNDLQELQISSMKNTWDNDLDRQWDEL